MHRHALAPCLVLALACAASGQVVHETGSLRGFIAGHEAGCAYDNWLSHISEGIARPGYNAYAPARLDRQMNGFGAFEVLDDDAPGEDTIQLFRELAFDLFVGDTATAAERLATGPAIDYELVALHDVAAGRDYLILRETLAEDWMDPGISPGEQDDVVGGFDHGWGLFVFNPDGIRPELCVQVPHPCDDYPSGYLGLEFFLEADAGLLQINGAGREVVISGTPGSYNNDRSLSDPTRNCFHPFEAIYESYVVHWRDQGLEDLMVQVHTYDDLSHRDLKSCVVTGGRYNRIMYPVLYDTGGGSRGLLTNLVQPVHQPNSLGFVHGAWRIQDYIASNQLYPIDVDGGIPDSSISISVSPNLWGDQQNCMMNYAFGAEAAGWPECDSNERIIHVEFDELPTPAHGLGEPSYYGVGTDNPDTLVADWQNFQMAWNFVRPFFSALITARDSLRLGGDPPPTVPGDLRVTEVGETWLNLAWEPSLSSLFGSYEILYDESGTIGPEARIFDDGDDGRLCWPGNGSVRLTGLEFQQSYALAIRAVDHQGRVSALSNTVLATADDDDPPATTFRGPRFLADGEGTYVEANIADYSGVATAELRWSTDGFFWNAVPMTSPGGNRWRAYVPEQPAGSAVFVRIEAVDGSVHANATLTGVETLPVLAVLWNDACESGTALTHASFGGRVDQWRMDASRFFSGLGSWRFGGTGGADYVNNAAGWLTTPELELPLGLDDPLLGFWSWIDAEASGTQPDSCWDGGTVQWSLDGGAWTTAPLEPDYSHGLKASSNVPLDGPLPMLSGQDDWRHYVVQLPGDADRLRLRFGFVSDNSNRAAGWNVDQIELAGVLAATPPSPPLALVWGTGRLRFQWAAVAGATVYRLESADEPWQDGWTTELETTATEADLPLPAGNANRCFRVIVVRDTQ